MRALGRLLLAAALLAAPAGALAQWLSGTETGLVPDPTRRTISTLDWQGTLTPFSLDVAQCNLGVTAALDPSISDSSTNATVRLYACRSATTDPTACRELNFAPASDTAEVGLNLTATGDTNLLAVPRTAATGGDTARLTITCDRKGAAEGFGAGSDAYAPDNVANWGGSDPGDKDDALDYIANGSRTIYASHYTTGSATAGANEAIAAGTTGDVFQLPRSSGSVATNITEPIVLGGLKNATTAIAKSLHGYGAGFKTGTPSHLGGTYLRFNGVADPSTTTVGTGSTSSTLVVAESLTNANARNRWVRITSGAASGATRLIRSISGTTLTIEPNWATVPSNGDTYVVENRCAMLIAGTRYSDFRDFMVDANSLAQYALCYMGENANSAPSFRNKFDNISVTGGTVKNLLVTGLDVGGADTVGISDQVDTSIFTNFTARGAPGGILIDSINAVELEFEGGACEDYSGYCIDGQRGDVDVRHMGFTTADAGALGGVRIRELAKAVRVQDNHFEVTGSGIVFDTTDIDSSGTFGRHGFLTIINGNRVASATNGAYCLLYNHFGALVVQGNQCGFRGSASSGLWTVQPDTGIAGQMRLVAGANDIVAGITQVWPTSRASGFAPAIVSLLPTSPQNGDHVILTTALAKDDCTTGGAEIANCVRVAGAWESVGGDGGLTSITSLSQIDSSLRLGGGTQLLTSTLASNVATTTVANSGTDQQVVFTNSGSGGVAVSGECADATACAITMPEGKSNGTDALAMRGEDSLPASRSVRALAVFEKCVSATIPAMATDVFSYKMTYAATLTKFWGISSGSITTAPTYDLMECTSAGASCTANTTTDLVADGDGDEITSFGGAAGSALDASDVMQFDSTNTGVIGGTLTLQFCFEPT